MTFNKLISATYIGPPKKNDERVIEKFLLWPLWIRGECRWLEKARIRQIYTNWKNYTDYDCGWKNAEFINYERQGK